VDDLRPDERSEAEGIAATSVPRTLLDLATKGPARRLESAVERAERLGLLDLIAVDSVLENRQGHPGRRRLIAALELYRAPGFTRSRAELAFLKLVEEAGLPRPATNFFVAGYEVDAFWQELAFAVEIDGWSTHGDRRSFESDRVRQEDLKLAGIEMTRVTATRIEREPAQVAQRLRILLDNRATQQAAGTTLSPHTGDNVAGTSRALGR